MADDTASDRWMTYADAAQALGMTSESLRQRARREHWRKMLGNDGRALVLVSADTARNPITLPADDTATTQGDAAAVQPETQSDTDRVITALRERIADLDARATELRADIERERAERHQERGRSEKLVSEVADLARQLATAVEDAGARERELHVRVATAEVALVGLREAHLVELQALREQHAADGIRARIELTQHRLRPWWRRLVG